MLQLSPNTATQSPDPRALDGPTTAKQRRPGFPPVARLATAVLLLLSAFLLTAAPAQAASYRDVKSVKYGTCMYAYGDPLEDIYSQKCSTTPAKYGNWSVTNAGYYNNHPLWIIKRQGGTCMGVLGTASSNYLYSSCAATNSRDVWEVFTTSNHRRVLKSFGAYQSWGQHKCLNFTAAAGMGSVRLAGCSLTSTADQIYW